MSILFAKKKDGGLRLYVNYRALNKITIKNRYSLPLISEALDWVSGAKHFAKIDIRSAYNFIHIHKGNEWKTAFRTRYGHFEYLVMPFGLANAPATFQAYINQALYDLLDFICIAYMDDILIYTGDHGPNTDRVHEEAVKQVLRRLLHYGLYAKLEKCEFSVSEIDFLGFHITPEGITMEESRIDTISKWPIP